MDTANTLQIGDRVIWCAGIDSRAFFKRYQSYLATVVAVSKSTVHIRVQRRYGAPTMKWVKRSRVEVCTIPDLPTARRHAARIAGGYGNGN